MRACVCCVCVCVFACVCVCVCVCEGRLVFLGDRSINHHVPTGPYFSSCVSRHIREPSPFVTTLTVPCVLGVQ